MKIVTYGVPNISCGHCVQSIEKALAALEGVVAVKAEAAGKRVTIEFGAPASEEKIIALLNEIGYAPQMNDFLPP